MLANGTAPADVYKASFSDLVIDGLHHRRLSEQKR